MRHEHQPIGGQDADYLPEVSAEEMAERRGHKVPAARAPSQYKALQEKHSLDSADVVVLTQTLVSPLPPRGALLHALSLGSRLLPGMRALWLYVTPDGTLESLTLAGTVIHRDEQHANGLEAGAQDVWQACATLGHGAEMDHGVLDDHATYRAAGITGFPMLGPENELVGALVVEERNERHAGEHHPLLDILLHCLTALLERQRLAHAAFEEGHARDEFISLAAHELRSPLTSIKGYAQLLVRQSRKMALPDPMQRSVEAIEQQSLRMAEMVGELLDASRIRRGVMELQPAPTDLVPLAQRLIEKRQSHYPRHTITLATAAPSLVGNWDTQRVEQILRDLLDNAARYSPEGGTIALTLASEVGMAVLSIRDEGIGIMPADQQRIFEYLYRAPTAEERNLSGLGLGLYICRYLAERMGGQLILVDTQTDESPEETHGSEFRLLLPLA